MKLNAKQIAEEASLGSFLNCYLRETGNGRWQKANEDTGRLFLQTPASGDSTCEHYVTIRLPLQNVTLYAGVTYKSPTGRHLFAYPVYFQAGKGTPLASDYTTVIVLLIKELSLAYGEAQPDELILRVIQSCRNIQRFIQARCADADLLYGVHGDFIDAEQALLFGHLHHPSPKSRQGFPEWNQDKFAPEMKGEFQLHYFWAHRSLVREGSALETSASELIKEELERDPDISESFLQTYGGSDDCLIPIHPIQADWLLSLPLIQDWRRQGLLRYLGPQGRAYLPTSSIRTVYHPDARFMLKLSLHVKVTNSLRVNKYKELVSGVEIARLLQTCVGDVRKHYPQFAFIGDPAYVTLGAEGQKETGFEVILRENPFHSRATRNVTLIAALTQDPLPGHPSRLAAVIGAIALREGRSVSQVSLEWFRRYLDISLRPMLWLFLKYGIALEAHQQNCLVQLDNGYPQRFYFRDNQGYYYCRSVKPMLDRILPGVGEESGNVYDDHIVDERYRYYLIVNHMLGLINGFGAAGLVSERVLLAELRAALESFLPMNREPSRFLHSLLNEEKLSCKANLLTRLLDVDELDNPLEQAVYIKIDNPLVKELPSRAVIHKAKQITSRWRKEQLMHV